MTDAAIRAIVINVGTELATTVALASLREHAPDVAILLANADPSLESQRHFERLADEWGFDLRVVPRRTHSATLDALVEEIDEPELLLFDSDLELRDPTVIVRMRQDLAEPGTYGAGFAREGDWAAERWVAVPKTCWCPERFWTPCALLRTDVVREARRDGIGFATSVVFNDFARSRYLSALLAGRFESGLTPTVRWLRLVPRRLRPRIQRARLPWLRWARTEFEGVRPNFVYFDTGARLHRWCRDRGLRFAGPPSTATEQLIHLRGASIELLAGGAESAEVVRMERDLQHRLLEHYGIEWSSFGVPAWSAPHQPA